LILPLDNTWGDDHDLNTDTFNCEDHYAGSIAGKKYLSSSFTWENDSFVFDSDEHYTNGMRLRFINNPLCNSSTALEDIFRKIFSLGKFKIGEPKTGKGEHLITTGWSFGMNMYTPRDISNSNPQPNDRPWSGWAYFGQHLMNHKNYLPKENGDEDESIHYVEIQVGALDKWSQQDLIQKAWHELRDTTTPEGWDNQQSGKIGVNMYYSYTSPLKGRLNSYAKGSSASWRTGFALGNVFRTINLGITARWNFLGLSEKDLPDVVIFDVRDGPIIAANDRTDYDDIPVSVITNQPKDGLSFTPPPTVDVSPQKTEHIWKKKTKSRQIWRRTPILGVFANFEARYINYSHFLEGTSVETLPLVYDVEFGLMGKCKNSHIVFQLSLLYRSPEFETVDDVKAESNLIPRFTVTWVWDSIVN